jgi:TolA-binding protein
VAPAQPKATSTPRAEPKRAAAPRVAAPVLPEKPARKPDPRKQYEAFMQQGFQLYRSGWYGPAMGRFRQATTVIPKSAYAHLWVGRAGIKAGRHAEAREALERVIELAPTSDVARQARALLDEAGL